MSHTDDPSIWQWFMIIVGGSLRCRLSRFLPAYHETCDSDHISRLSARHTRLDRAGIASQHPLRIDQMRKRRVPRKLAKVLPPDLEIARQGAWSVSDRAAVSFRVLAENLRDEHGRREPRQSNPEIVVLVTQQRHVEEPGAKQAA